MPVIEVALSEREIAETKRRVRALRGRVADTSGRDKVEIDAGTLDRILRFVEAAEVRSLADQHEGDEELSPQEAAELLRMSRPSVMRLVAKGLLHRRKVLSRYRLSRAEVIAFREHNARRQREALEHLSALSEADDF